MSRIGGIFERLARQRRKALIPFITAGDPAAGATVPVMHALAQAGADVIGSACRSPTGSRRRCQRRASGR
jgi:tryptophan synthase alpha subunit